MWWVLVTLVVLVVLLGWQAHHPLSRIWRIAQTSVRKKRDNAVTIGIIGDLDHATKKTIIYPARKLSSVRIVAVASVTDQPINAASYDYLHVYNSAVHLLADVSVQTVYISAPPQEQPALIRKALAAGKHVICAPPMCVNVTDVRDMVVQSAQVRRSLIEAFAYRHHPVIGNVRDLVHANKLGVIRSVQVAIRLPFYFYSNKILREGTGAMHTIGIHAIHCLRFIMGAEPKPIKATPRTMEQDKKSRLDEAMFVELIFDRFETIADMSVREQKRGELGAARVTATVEVDMKAWRLLPEASIKILGSEKDLHLDNFLWPHFFHTLTLRNKKTHKITMQKNYGDGSTPEDYQMQAIIEEIAYKIPACLDQQDGVKTTALLDAIYTLANMTSTHKKSGTLQQFRGLNRVPTT